MILVLDFSHITRVNLNAKLDVFVVHHPCLFCDPVTHLVIFIIILLGTTKKIVHKIGFKLHIAKNSC